MKLFMCMIIQPLLHITLLNPLTIGVLYKLHKSAVQYRLTTYVLI